MFCPNCGTELEDTVNFCTECGHDISDRTASESQNEEAVAESPGQEDGGPSGTSTERTEPMSPDVTTSVDRRQAAESTIGVPADAAAIDITCQHCGKRPIQEMAKGHRISGFVLFYRQKTYQLLGCHKCIRSKLWRMSVKNLFLGWWGIRAALLNAGFTIKNIVRGAINRGPNENLVESLEDVGVTYDFLADPDDFNPARHSPMELHIRSFVRLGTAIMNADGQALPEERQAIKDAISAMDPAYPEDKLEELIDRASRSQADIERVAEGIGELLGSEGRELVIGFVSSIADAGTTGDEDIEYVAAIARALNLDEDDVRTALNEASPIQSPEAA